ncbi:MAG TPA: G5 domain-containing protein [Candidatus Limnocylindria bacterium]|nr:G5 domain-containing protein [Candidatus Limnocylindria bacterium]
MLQRILRTAALAVAAFLMAAGTWAFVSPAAARGPIAAPSQARALGAARFRPLAAIDADTAVLLVIDGVSLATEARSGSTVADLLGSAGLLSGPADRLSVPPDTAVVPGLRIVVDRGFPVTLVDGGRSYAMRARAGTVADFLALSGISVAAGDRLVTPAHTALGPGSTVEIDRVADARVEQDETVPHGVVLLHEADQFVGWQQVETLGQDGRARVTYLVRFLNGSETERTVVATTELQPPVIEIRHIGTRLRPAPPAPAEIAAIIHAAAAKYGVDADQLLRVTYCESRYDPSAYNGVLGASGLFQIIPSTWTANSVRAGYGGASVWDPVANANVAAWMFSRGQAYQWACK